MRTALVDTETVGLYGPAAIIQVQFDYETDLHDDQPFIYDPWNQPAYQTRRLIEEIVECRVVAHNLTFDWQKLSQFYNALSALDDNECPINHVNRFAQSLYENRSKWCLKPAAAVCTLLLAQKNLGGSALAAKEIRIRKLPIRGADHVARALNERCTLPEILFARRKSPDRWSVVPNDKDPGWFDVVLRFGPTNALKDIAKHVLGVDDTTKIGQDVLPPEFPFELGHAPYAELLDNTGDWQHLDDDGKVHKLWPLLIHRHVDFWTSNPVARQYAVQDIVLLKRLLDHLGNPDTDFDSEIACQVASVRVAGMAIDKSKLRASLAESQAVVDSARLNVDSPAQVRQYITESLDGMEALIIADSCDKDHLKDLSKQLTLDEREDCELCDQKGCPRCDGLGYVGPGPMPVVARAQHILEIRKHRKRVQLYHKLVQAGSAFPSFRVIGTKSGRMSGADGLNYHGIDGSRDIREIFTLADQDDWVVSGGDMNSQELAITAAVMKDTALGEVLEDGKKLHAIFAAEANGVPYEQIMKYADDKTRPESKWYAQGKVTSYSILYGASSFKVAMDLGCTVDEADKKIQAFFAKFPGMSETRKAVKRSLDCLGTDENGRLSAFKPQQDYVESVFGFRRSFQTELAVMDDMLEVMRAIPKSAGFDEKVVRTEKKGEQTVAGATSSALYAAVFSLQGKVFRAACNHLIQSSGRTCTLRVQHRIWNDLQPQGINPYRVKMMSVHDEIITTCHRNDAQAVQDCVASEMKALTRTIPLLSLDWAIDVGSWYGAKTCDGTRTGWGS